MADETPDRVAATLAGIRADAQSLAQTNSPSWGTVPKIRRVIAGTERLLGAVEAALKAAGDWDAEAARLDKWAGRLSAEGGRVTAAAQHGRAEAHRSCARVLRAAITAALTGEDAGDGG